MAYFTIDGQAFINSLAQEPLAGPVALIKNALAQLRLHEAPHLELAADYAQTFLGDNSSSALPYASLYLSPTGLLFQQPHDDMLTILKSEGLALTEQFNEPADHLAVMLDYLGNQALRLAAAQTEAERRALYRQQLEFIEQHLLTWVPEFSARCGAIKGTGFYPALARFLLAYLVADKEHLEVALIP